MQLFLPCKGFAYYFNKLDRHIGKFNKTKYIPLTHSNEKYNKMFNRIRYLIMLKSNISNVVSSKYIEIKIRFTFRKNSNYA